MPAKKNIVVTYSELDYWHNQLGWSLKEIGNKLGCSASNVSKLMKKLDVPHRPAGGPQKYPRYDFSGNLPEQAYLIGFRTGDLYAHLTTDGNNCQTVAVESSSTKAEQIALIRQLFEPYGHVYTVTRRSRNTETGIKCYLNLTFDFLLSKPDRVPIWIMENNACFWAFLAGYIDAEGHIGIDRSRACPQARLQIISCDIGILNDLRAGLVAHGVHCPPVRLHLRKGTPIGKKQYRIKRNSYRLSVNSKVSLNRLFEQIEPYLKHKKRCADMMIAWENIRSRGLPQD